MNIDLKKTVKFYDLGAYNVENPVGTKLTVLLSKIRTLPVYARIQN